ncbi:DUF1272 domain-containing protein [Psychroserpens sp. AS72]|uniref:DUF1272 domain-containing protein n=1 Tax=Psychroserpens sp. AS72 TaxID=3135775 RepID=UPI00317324B4
MLEVRPTCENCNTSLPYDSKEAMICTFECTFCRDCVSLLKEVCPNCGGNFTERPIRPTQHLKKYPVSETIVFKPVDLVEHYKKIDNI